MVGLSLTTLLALSTVALAAPRPDDYNNNQEGGDDNNDNVGRITKNIKNIVVLVEENRSFDTFAGGLTYNKNIDGLIGKSYCNPVNASDPTSGVACSKPIAEDVSPDDPNHGISGVNYELFGTFHPDEAAVAAGKLPETMQGFVTEQASVYKTTNVSRAAEAINYYTQDQIRVFAAMAENYVLFDRWFSAVPGPTNPNRAYLTSGTSHGHGRNDNDFNIANIPVKSIFQQLSEKGVSWINYSNTTGFQPDALFYQWTVSSGAATKNIKSLSQFYTDAAAGKLPQFTYINPECCSYQSFHPPSAITEGESFIKKIYEALRASPQWEETLFILTFDENGGFGDHVPPPVHVPAGDSLTYSEKAPDGKNITFDFTRLGVRVPTLLISPWVDKGIVEKKGRNNGGEYSHTSLVGFIENFFGMSKLTSRVSWSATFEHLITNKLRRDTPKTLPNAYPF